jgi:hypothetical protein
MEESLENFREGGSSMKGRMKEPRNVNHEKSRYVIRRFVPALFLAVIVNISCLAIDVSKVPWVGVTSGALLAGALFLIRTAAEKRFPGSSPTTGGT